MPANGIVREAVMRIICPNCGVANSGDAHVCCGCGRVMVTAAGRPSPLRVSDVFVGRQRELAILGRKLGEALAGRGGLAMLVGEAGIGKTWVAHRFAGDAKRRGATVLTGCCFEGEWQPPYAPWSKALGEYARACGAERLSRDVGWGAAVLAPLVPEVEIVLAGIPVAAPLSPDEERFRLYNAMTQLLLTVAEEKALVVVLDDLQWADRDSLHLLRHIARFVQGARLLVVGVYREPEPGLGPQHPLMDALAMLCREVDHEQITIRGFSRDEVAEYLAQVSGHHVPQRLIKAIHEETGGNPFYVREIFRHLLEERKIRHQGDQWFTDGDISQMGIPDSVRQVVARRASRLSRETREMLSFAAGFTGAFDFLVVQALMGLHEDKLLNCIDEALEAGLIRVANVMPPTYEFSHALVRHVLYDELNPDRQARFHRRIAVALEHVYAGREAEHAAELAAQYYASADLAGADRGVRYALMAADQARASYSHERAVEFLRMARRLSTESEPAVRADILCKLTIAEAEALLLDEAGRSAQEALALLAEAQVEPRARARAEFLASAARVLKDGGASSAIWRPLVEMGLEFVGGERDLLWARLALLRDRYEIVSTGGFKGIRWLGADSDAVAIARADGDEDDYAQTLDPLDWRSREETDAVLALVRTWQRPTAIMRALDAVGRDLLKRHGAHREAAERYKELLEAGERYGSIPRQAEALLQLSIINIALGEFPLALQTTERAREMILRLGPAHELRFGEAALSAILAYFLDGDWPTLAAKMTQSVVSGQTAQNPRAVVAAGYAAIGHARAGNVDEVQRILEAVTPLVEQMDPRLYVHHAVITFGGSAVWETGSTEFAASYRNLALSLINAGFGEGILAHELTVARMAALLGDMDEASRYFAVARRKLEAGGLRPTRAIVDYDEALALIRAGSGNRAHILVLLNDAAAAFDVLGMGGWVQRAQTLRGSVASKTRRPLTRASPLFPDGLTSREVEVLGLLAAGKTSSEIAKELTLSVRTVERHIANVYGKTGAHGRASATAYAMRRGLA